MMNLEQMMLHLYSFLLAVILVLVSPLLLLRPKTRAGLKGKLGFIDKNINEQFSEGKEKIWIHAVSVGEFNAAYPFIEAIKTKYPNIQLVVSTTTKAGQAMAVQRAGAMANIIYFPFDLPWSVNRWLSLIKPSMVIIFETELWPNFIYKCWQRHIPIVLLNARMSPRSFNGYQSIKWLFAPLLNKLTLIGAQTLNEAERYKTLAGDNLAIKVFGNLKYDWPALIDKQANKELKSKLGIESSDLVLVAGSTHFGEEKLVLDVLKRFGQNSGGQKLKLIIAPRHPERFEQVAKIIEDEGYTVRRYSSYNSRFVEPQDVYLLDTIGQLANFYALASIAFVGGTIARVGGHNLLEPYLYSVAAVCGPHLFKTREVATILSYEKALFIGDNIQEVEDKIIQLLQDADLRVEMGKRGKSWLESNQGAVAKSLEAISAILDKTKEIKVVRHS